MKEFETFWAAWPNRKAKKAALRAFNTAIREADIETILAGVESYKRHKEPWRAWMHPATWLNGGCWDDEYETAPEVAAPFRSYDSWSDADKAECADVVTRKGTDTAINAYRYTRAQIDRLRADGYLGPRQVEQATGAVI